MKLVIALTGWTLLALSGLAVAADALAPAPAAMRVLRLDPALDAVIAPGTLIERVATGFKFTEGPMWREGRLWFVDLRDNKMLALSPDGRVQVLIAAAGGVDPFPPGSNLGPNAMVTDRDGSVLMIQQGGRRIVRLDSHLGMHPILATYQGKKLNSPNDLVFAPDGALWFTDPPFGLLGMDQDPAKELAFNGVFRYAHGSLKAEITDLTLPNGIGFSRDGKTLYVSNYGPHMYVMAYELGADGTPGHGHMLIDYPDRSDAQGAPDGLKIDTAGNIWTTGPGGIRIITPAGKVLGQIILPEVAANIAFADGGRTAYITASTSVYRLKAATPGQMPRYVKDDRKP
jgi:gluconolactonase